MFWSILVIAFVAAYFFLEAYQLRYFFETNYLATSFSSEGLHFKKWSLRQQTPEETMRWSDIASCKLIQGFDSSRRWYSNIKQRFGTGIYCRLVVQTKSQGTFVFHLLPVPTLSTFSPLHRKMSAFSKNGELLKELEKQHIHVERKEISLIEAITDKQKDWYRNH